MGVYDKFINPTLLNMYVVAVQTGRFTIDMLNPIYQEKVAEILGIKLNKEVK